jgi:hypothetical protein
VPQFDRVLKTVLFIDIVGSTDRVAEVKDQRWIEVLDLHEKGVRAELHGSKGRRSTRQATASSPRSTVRPAPSGAPRRSRQDPVASASMCERDSIRASARCAITGTPA